MSFLDGATKPNPLSLTTRLKYRPLLFVCESHARYILLLLQTFSSNGDRVGGWARAKPAMLSLALHCTLLSRPRTIHPDL